MIAIASGPVPLPAVQLVNESFHLTRLHLPSLSTLPHSLILAPPRLAAAFPADKSLLEYEESEYQRGRLVELLWKCGVPVSSGSRSMRQTYLLNLINQIQEFLVPLYFLLKANQDCLHSLLLETLKPASFEKVSAEAFTYLSICSQDLHPSFIKGKGRSKQGYSILNLFLSYSKASVSRNVIKSWFRSPLSSKTAIQQRLDAVQFLIASLDNEKELNKLLAGLGNPSQIAHKLIKGAQNNWNSLIRSLNNLVQVARYFHGLQHKPKLLQQLCDSDEAIKKMQRLREVLSDCLDQKDNTIRTGVNNQLDSLRRLYSYIDQFMLAHQKEQSVQLGRPVSLAYLSQLGYFILTNQEVLDEQVEFQFKIQNNYYFKTKRTKALDNQYGDIVTKINQLQHAIFRQLRLLLLQDLVPLSELVLKIAKVDALFTFAKVGAKMVRPVLNADGDLMVVGGWHLLLPNNVVANNCFSHKLSRSQVQLIQTHQYGLLSDRFSNRVLFMTGPNASGKSVYAKQTGVIVFLAQIGSFVPALSASVPLVDRIMCLQIDFSLNQNQTYEQEQIKVLSQIIQRSTQNSLVIVDQLGSRLSHKLACALNYALIQHFTHRLRPPLLILISHLIELINYDLLRQNQWLRFVRMQSLQRQGIRINNYEMKTGYMTQSLSVQVAEQMGTNKQLLHKARKFFKRIVRGQPLK